jgi:peptide/nickel transport system substrate-binding protein
LRLRLVTACVIALILVNVLLVSSLPSAFSSSSAQPPVDVSTYRSATIGQPVRIDPARAYDTASGELIQNVYETLIFFGDKPLAPQANAEITDEYVVDTTVFVPVLATKVPSIADGDISPDGKNWTFTINTNAVFQPWMNGLLVYEPVRNLTVDDVVYSFQRQMVYDSYYGPTWMWFEPAFGIKGWSAEVVGGPFSTYDNGTFKNPEDEVAAGNMIRSWVYAGPGPNQVTFHFQMAWTENVLKQFFAVTWSSILNKDWVIENGGWDGQFSPGWTNNYHWKPTKTRSELDEWKDPAVYGAKGSKYTNATAVPNMCGTGPYRFTSWDKVTKIWQIDKFTDYWRGWSGNHLTTVIKEGIDAEPTRKEKLLSGEFDDCAVSTANMWDLLNSSDASGHTPILGVRLYWGLPSSTNTALVFQFEVSADSPYVPKNGTTPAPSLFADVHMRRAFAYAFNFTQFFRDYYGDSIQPASWWLRGMKPDYENRSLIPRNVNSSIVGEELKAAGVWEQGFEAAFVYGFAENNYAYAMYSAERKVADLFAAMNPKFNVSVIGIGYLDYRNYSDRNYLPIFDFGWLADFGDPENTAREYMHSEASLASWQNYNDTYVDQLVDLGLSQPDGPERNATYQELQYIYWRDVPSLPVIQSTGRRWSREWVKGWYYNPWSLGPYYYDLYKEALSTPSDGGGQVVDYSVPIIVCGIFVATTIVGSAIYVKHRKKELPPTKEKPNVR